MATRRLHTKSDCPYTGEIIAFTNDMARMKEDIKEVKDLVSQGFKDIRSDIRAQVEYNEKTYARKDEVSLLIRLVYGGVAFVLITALGFALKVIFGW